jgi:general secretion pathway protein G
LVIGASGHLVIHGEIEPTPVGASGVMPNDAPNDPMNAQMTKCHDDQMCSSQRGFTLIELTIVIAILVVLASIGMAQYRGSLTHAREAVLKEDLFGMRDAIDQYYADKNSYPDSIDTLVSSGYIRAVPKDPITKSDSTWQTVMSEPDPSNPTAQPGVYDIKSGADGTALDGSKFSDW